MLRLLTRFACPRRALHWGNVAPGRNLPLTRSWPVVWYKTITVDIVVDTDALVEQLRKVDASIAMLRKP
jgi:hypothetical protein